MLANMFDKVRNRIIILLILIALFFTAIIYYNASVRSNELESLALNHSKEKNELMDVVLSLSRKTLYNFSYDYTYWDDMIRFVKNPKADWAYENIESSIEAFDIDYAWVYNENFELKYSINHPKVSKIESLPLTASEFNELTSKNWFNHFYFLDNGEYVEIYMAPIQPTNDKERSTKPNGFFCVGKRYGGEYLSKLKSLLGTEVTIVEYGNLKSVLEIIQSHSYSLFNYKQFNNWQDKPVAYILSWYDDDALFKMNSASNEQYLIIISFSLLLLSTVAFGLYNWVIKPLAIISKSLVEESTDHLAPIEKHKTEFSSFAILIRKFLKQKESLEEEIRIRKETEYELLEVQNNLANLVESRTLELADANKKLEKERDSAKRYLDVAGTVIAILDPSGRIELINQKGMEILCCDESIIGKNWFDFLAKEDAEEFKTYLECNDQNIKTEPVVFNIVDGNSELRNLLFNFSYVKEGSSNKLIFSASDITSLKKVEQELILAKEQAEESSRIKSAFFINVSHELRTPMMGILGNAEMMMLNTNNPDLVKMSNTIIKSGKRLQHTLDSILGLSRLETGEDYFDFTQFDLVAAAEEIVNSYRQAALKKNLDLELFSNEKEIVIINDERVLYDIMNNLINNAIKFTNQGRIIVKVETKNSSFLLHVSDTGMGIMDNKKKIIFSEFRQVSEGFGRSFEGTGLGLTITQKYVEKLGGHIYLESEINKGSTFIIELPIDGKSAIFDKNKRVNNI